MLKDEQVSTIYQEDRLGKANRTDSCILLKKCKDLSWAAPMYNMPFLLLVWLKTLVWPRKGVWNWTRNSALCPKKIKKTSSQSNVASLFFSFPEVSGISSYVKIPRSFWGRIITGLIPTRSYQGALLVLFVRLVSSLKFLGSYRKGADSLSSFLSLSLQQL